MASTPLCKDCASINFVRVFKLKSHNVGADGKQISPLRHVLEENCELCKVIQGILSVKLRQEDVESSENELGFHLRACDSLGVLRQRRTESARRSNDIVIMVIPGLPTKSKLALSVKNAIIRGFIVQESEGNVTGAVSTRPLAYRGRQMAADINFPLISQWLGTCRDMRLIEHLHCNLKNEILQDDALSRFYVLDCVSRQIVRLLPGMEFMALSYVWGKPEACDGSNEPPEIEATFKALPNPMPRTIEDAISVVISLRMKYLWVDRYCIPSEREKHSQIQNMHLIYKRAIATIVAANGIDSSADSGLHGLSVSRRAQPRVKLKGTTLLGTFPHLSYHLSNSKWATRGWTYQEAVISTRCLFFTVDQVYFACKSMTLQESVTRGPVVDTPGKFEPWKLDASIMKIDGPRIVKRTQRDRRALYGHISEYTSRSLTYEADILNAFRGILADSHQPSYWGIPGAQDNRHIHFALALLWARLDKKTTVLTCGRRVGFPTWSWASLKGQVEFLMSATKTSKQAKSLESSSMWIESKSGTLVEIDPALERAEETGYFVEENSRKLYIRGEVIEVYISRCRSGWTATYELHPFGNVFIDDKEIEELLDNERESVWHALRIAWEPEPSTYDWRSLGAASSKPEYWLLLNRDGEIAKRIGLIETFPPSLFKERRVESWREHSRLQMIVLT